MTVSKIKCNPKKTRSASQVVIPLRYTQTRRSKGGRMLIAGAGLRLHDLRTLSGETEMADRSDAWWAGKALAEKAAEWTKSGNRVSIYVLGATARFEADSVELDSYVALFIDGREGAEVAVAKGSIAAVSIVH